MVEPSGSPFLYFVTFCSFFRYSAQAACLPADAEWFDLHQAEMVPVAKKKQQKTADLCTDQHYCDCTHKASGCNPAMATSTLMNEKLHLQEMF